jgi:hypothetical protein
MGGIGPVLHCVGWAGGHDAVVAVGPRGRRVKARWTCGYEDGLSMKKEYWLYGLAVVTGILVWVAVSNATGRREAWDSQWYFLISVPVVCVVSAALGFVEPSRPWRWGVAPLVGQFSWMLFTQGPGNLLPLGVVVFGVLSVPSIITARIGAFFGNKRAK